MSPISNFRIEFELPREKRFDARGVPVIELWVSGPDYVFQRVAGICDSGASRTLLAKSTWERLGYNVSATAARYACNGLTHQILYVRQVLQLRITAAGRPPIHVVLRAGLTNDIEENLFGADLVEYFGLLVTRDRVTLLGDPVEEA